MTDINETEFGPEYLLIFVGYSSDADYLAEALIGLEPTLQRELDKLRRVNSTVPFNRVKIWKWDSDASAIKGGQEAVITPALKRANIAIFVFNERVGEVAWRELNYAINRKPPIPVLPFFKSTPPSQEQMMKESVAELWVDLLKKSKSLAENWTDPETNAVTPLPKYSDKNELINLATYRLTAEIVRLASVHDIRRKEVGESKFEPLDSDRISINSLILGLRSSGENLIYNGHGNILSLVPSGENRHLGTVFPNLKNFKGACLILDPTGDIYRGTVKDREKIGEVLKLDPWSIIPDGRIGSLNPLDVILKLGLPPNDAARFLAELFMPYTEYNARRRELITSEPFWLNMGRKFMLGLILLSISESANNEAILTKVRNILHEDDLVYYLASKLDTKGKEMEQELKQELAFFLQQADNTRTGIAATVSQFVMALGSSMAQRLTDTTSIDIERWLKGEPISVYLIGPPAGIASFDAIYRAWVGSLLLPVLMRPATDERSLLMVLDIDETFDLWNGISNAYTQGRNCQVWTIASDISDLENCYKQSFKTILNSVNVIQTYKPNNYLSADDISKVIGIDSKKIMQITDSQQIVTINGREPEILTRLDKTK